MTTDGTVLEMLMRTVTERDLASLQQGALELKKRDAVGPIEHGDLSVVIQADPLSSKMSEDQGADHQNRYIFEGQQASKNNGVILKLKDVNLKRSIDARLVQDSADADGPKTKTLVHEALMLSFLDHPGIPPIYDLDRADTDQIYYMMKRIDGVSLSALTIQSADTEAKKYARVDEIVGVFIKIAEVIAYAHSHGVIHRDIKPVNIVLGEYGAVYIVDWKTSIRLTEQNEKSDEDFLCGTPLYMSPEQAAGSKADKRSDIYSLGASMFHVLVKRPPLSRDNIESFWKAKQLGHIDAYDKGSDIAVPAPLLAICMRCLAQDPGERYQNVSELTEDLKKYQSGQMVDVYEYKFSDLIVHWLKSNRMHLKWAALFIIAVLIAGLLAYRVSLRELGQWGDPIYEEAFDDGEQWKEHWHHEFRKTELLVNDGLLVTQNGPEFLWFYKTRLEGSVAIEFEGKILDGSVPGDLSIAYCSDIEAFLEHDALPPNTYYLQHGAYNNACSMIEGPNGRLDYSSLKLRAGVTYKIRGEVDGKTLNLFLDGKQVCSYELLSPLNSGYIGIYAYFDGKSIDNIKIYNRSLPEVTEIIKTGDILLENELYELAAERYQKIYETYAGTETGQECLYKIGLCKYNLEEIDAAFNVWASIGRSKFDVLIRSAHWNQWVEAEKYEEVILDMYEMYPTLSAPLQVQLREHWGVILSYVRQMGFKDITRKFLSLRDRYFPNDRIFSAEVYNALVLLEEIDKIPKIFPEMEQYVISALSEMGAYDRLLTEYSDKFGVRAAILMNTAQYHLILDKQKNRNELQYSAMKMLGMFDEMEEIWQSDMYKRAEIMLARGLVDEVEQEFKDELNIQRMVMLYRGDVRAYMETYETEEERLYVLRSVHGFDLTTSMIFDRYLAGEKGVLDELNEGVARLTYYHSTSLSQIFPTRFFAGVLHHLEGDPEPLQKLALKIWKERRPMMHMRLWHNAGLLLGKLSREQYYAQPYQRFIDFDYNFYLALHHDLYGDKKLAADHYEACNSIPRYQREDGILIRRFLSYRLKQISR